jgi:hypothetical protein
MPGRKERGQLELFITGSLRDPISDDHVLVKIDPVLDPGWLRGDVADLCCADSGCPGIDPEAAPAPDAGGGSARLCSRPASDAGRAGRSRDPPGHRRRLARGAAGSRVADAHPATLGRHVFRRVFTRVVRPRLSVGNVRRRDRFFAETVPIDASLIRANVSMDA